MIIERTIWPVISPRATLSCWYMSTKRCKANTTSAGKGLACMLLAGAPSLGAYTQRMPHLPQCFQTAEALAIQFCGTECVPKHGNWFARALGSRSSTASQRSLKEIVCSISACDILCLAGMESIGRLGATMLQRSALKVKLTIAAMIR